MDNPHDFIPGVTDQGPPRPAKGGFPYPGHGTVADNRSAFVRENAMVDLRPVADIWIATFRTEVA